MTAAGSDSELSAAREPQFIGYWRDPDDPATAHLPDPGEWVDARWDRKERSRLIRYLRSGRERASYLGYSWCRFHCGIPDSKLGSRDLTDGVYVWPEGFVHYVEKHAVKPPQAFLDHVRTRLKEQESAGSDAQKKRSWLGMLRAALRDRP